MLKRSIKNRSEDALLPTKKTEGIKTLDQLIIFCHGEHKIGKTTFWNAVFPEALFLSTDRGDSFITAYKKRITSWTQFLAVIDQLEKFKSKVPYKPVIVDLIDDIYNFAFEYVLSAHGVSYPDEIDGKSGGWGKGWRFVGLEFWAAIQRVINLDKGVVFISQTNEMQRQFADGRSINRMKSALGDSAKRKLYPYCDMILFVDSEEAHVKTKDGKLKPVKRRIIRTRPSLDYDAGCRGRLDSPILPDDIQFDPATFKQVYNTFLKESK